jgi:multiple sugar transport system permease protein
MIVSTKNTSRLWIFLRFSVLLLLLVIFFLPLVGMVLASLKQNSELYVFPPKILPKEAQWPNYATALTMINYGKFFSTR